MRRLSWLVALDPLLLGTAQCLLYLPVARRLVHLTRGVRFGYFAGTHCAITRYASQRKSNALGVMLSPVFACIDFWSVSQTGALVWKNLASFESLNSFREFTGDT